MVTRTKNARGGSRPMRMLVGNAVLTALLLGGMSLYGWKAGADTRRSEVADARLRDLDGRIALYDEILTMSALVGVATGDRRWEERYNQTAPKLDAAIREVRDHAGSAKVANAISATDVANVRLVALETLAFRLAHDGHRDSAMTLLLGSEYATMKQQYAAGMVDVSAGIAEHIAASKQGRTRFFSVGMLLMLLLLTVVWLGSFRITKRFIAEQREAQSVLRDRAQIATALNESEGRFRELFDSMSSGVAVCETRDEGVSFTFKDINRSAERIDSLRREEVVGRDVRQVFPGIEEFGLLAVLRRVWQTGEPERHPVGRYEDGRIAGWRENYVYRLASGEVVSVYDDVTARMQAEAAMRESEERYRDLFENATDLIQSVGPDGRYIFTNRRWRETLGYSEDEVTRLTMFDVLAPECHDHCRQLFGGLMLGGHVDCADTTFLAKDGRRVFVEGNLGCRLKDGKPVATRGFFRDITERKQAEAEIAQLSRQNRSILDAAGEGIIGLDSTGRCTFINPAAVQMLGFDSSELVGQDLHALTHHTKANGEPYPPEECPIYRAFNDGQTHKAVDELFWRRDGTSFPVEFTSTPVLEGEQLAGAVVTFKDITERKQAEEDLKLKANLLDSNTDSIFLHDPAGRFLYVNENSYKTRGYTKEGFLALNLHDLDVPEYASRIEPRIAEMLRTGETTFESAHFRRDRSVMPVEIHARMLKVGGRELILSVVRDITERKQSEAALAESELTYRRAFESSNDAMMLLDSEKFLDCNDATLRVFGYSTHDEFLGKHPGEVSPLLQADGRESRVAAEEEMATAVRDGRNFFEWLHQRADGTIFPADVLLTPLDYHGRMVLQATVRDITPRKIADAEIAQKNAELAKLNDLKNQFLGMAAHDLRNPLTVVNTASAFLLDDSSRLLSAEKKHDFIRRINANGEFMLRLIDDLLDVAKIESGRLDLELVTGDLCGLIEENLTMNRMLAEKKGIRLNFAPEGGVPLFRFDRGKVEQVLNNLISNALKFSASGTAVTLQASRVNGTVVVSVRDHGQGIPAEELDKLFKPFSKTTVRSTAGEKSTGLGLAICRKIIEGHHGRIWAESEPGKGSTFSFALPVASKDESQTPSLKSQTMSQ